jgi:hypothetical protein
LIGKIEQNALKQQLKSAKMGIMVVLDAKSYG